MESNPRKLQIWTGATDRNTREAWASRGLTISGYAGGKRLYRVMQDTYVTPPIPTATSSREERRVHEEHAEKVEGL